MDSRDHKTHDEKEGEGEKNADWKGAQDGRIINASVDAFGGDSVEL